jgi:TnpA family transposase
MSRRNLLTASERASLLALPVEQDELIYHYTLGESEMALTHQRRGAHNRLGFAVQWCYLHYPGCALPTHAEPPDALLSFVAKQLQLEPCLWEHYAQRSETRREHLAELQSWLGLTPFGKAHFVDSVRHLTELAQQTSRGMVLATTLLAMLREQRIMVPTVEVIERICAQAHRRGTQKVYAALTQPLTLSHRQALDRLLCLRQSLSINTLTWLRQPPGIANPKRIITHLERLQMIRELQLPDGLERCIHQNRLIKLAREGGQMTVQHLQDLEEQRRYATLVAIVLDTAATLTDEIIALHEHMLSQLFNRAKRNHAEQFQQSAKAVNEKLLLYSRIGRALLTAKQQGNDPFAAIESVIEWEHFAASVADAEKLSQPADFDYLPLLSNGFNLLRRYTPLLLETLSLEASPVAKDILAGVEILKRMNAKQSRKVPDEAPTSFVTKRWKALVLPPEGGIDRRFYELCVLSTLKNAWRSGDIWVQGSRQFRDFEDYLLPMPRFIQQHEQQTLGLAVAIDCEPFLTARLALLKQKLGRVAQLAADGALPGAGINTNGLKITPLTNSVPEAATTLIRQAYALMPSIKITELLQEVDHWTGFTRHFTNLKTNEIAADTRLLLTALLADGINLGLTKMAQASPGTSYAKLAWLQAWHIRDETYTAALAELTNTHLRQPFARYWGEGNTSSSDGQWFRAGGIGESAGHFNAKYGNHPGVTFYTHISDQYSPFHTKVINAAVRDATYVLDGLLYHESDLRIKEHYTDTAGFTDHVFGLMTLLGFQFAPRIRDLHDKKLYVPGDTKSYPILEPIIGGSVQVKSIQTHWDDILRLSASIKQGTVTASLMLRKLGGYPRQNGLALALRELGRMERTLFTLDWLQSIELRRKVQDGLNKGEARNALARAVFFNRLGELRDRRFENQCYRASGLNLVVAAIILWNTVYLERAIHALKLRGVAIDDSLLQYLSPLSWEHINLTGDYIWQPDDPAKQGQFRPLRDFDELV